ncbi:DUF2254 domain-containing protein [Verrucomicrobiaceae bacterium 227]
MKTLLTHVSEKLRASAWSIPTALAVAAILLAQGLLQVDHAMTWRTHYWISWIEISSPEGARTLLATIATSMLAIAGVSFSSIMVTMTLASQQFGPRLLRNFIKDKFSQTVLGMHLATFIYCLFILRGVRTTEELPFVPQLSTLTALVLGIVCLGLFIRFVHHIITEIQVERVASDAYQVLEESITSVFPDVDSDPQEYRVEENEPEGWQIIAGKTGYVQAINFEKLIEIAAEYEAVLMTEAKAGQFISKGKAIIRVIAGPSPDDAPTALIADIQNSFLTGSVRTSEQDFEYGIRQLVEVALRALSPGINDPFTAMNCIDYLGAGLQSAFTRPLPPSIHRDDDGNIRLFSWTNSYRSLVETALNQIRQAARDRCDVSCRLLEMLAETAKVSEREEQQLALMEQARLINLNTLPALFNDHDCDAISSRFTYFTNSCHLIDPFQNA